MTTNLPKAGGLKCKGETPAPISSREWAYNIDANVFVLGHPIFIGLDVVYIDKSHYLRGKSFLLKDQSHRGGTLQ